MRSKLSYYSVLLLVGLAVVAVFVFVMNPFNGVPAGASSPIQSATTTTVVSGTASPTSNGPAVSIPGSNSLQPAGTGGGAHDHHESGFSATGGSSSNSTTTTTTVSIYSQNE